jgi:hypothetical protein
MSNNLIGPWHARPPAGTKGTTFFPTNGNFVLVDNGKEWVPFSLLTPAHLPDLSQFFWVNQGNATIEHYNGPIFIHTPPGQGIPNINAFVRNIPVPPPYQTTISFLPLFSNAGISSTGICWRDSSNGRLMRFGPYFISGNGSIFLGIAQYDDPLTFLTTNLSDYGSWLLTGSTVNLRFTDDGTTRSCDYGLDGYHWMSLFKESSSNFFSPDQVGFFVESLSSEVAMTVLNFSIDQM